MNKLETVQMHSSFLLSEFQIIFSEKIFHPQKWSVFPLLESSVCSDGDDGDHRNVRESADQTR